MSPFNIKSAALCLLALLFTPMPCVDASRRHLQNSLGDWEFCTNSNQCKNQCCSKKYSTSDGRLKCTPVGGFKPWEGCVGSSVSPNPPPSPSPPSPSPPSPAPTGRGDWETCTNSNQCRNQCCSGKYSGGVLKCTPVGGFKPSEGCVAQVTPTPPPPSPPGPTPTPPPPTPPTGKNTATTTRYWDCSGGSCGCSFIPTGLGDNQPVHCHSNAMFVAPVGNPFGATYYGAAAISEALGGGNWMSSGCGKCWKVTGYSPITARSTTLVLKGTNFCPPSNAACANNKAHFDIAAPGFDVIEFSQSNTCSEREPEEAIGFASCGRWMIDSRNPNENCNCDSFNDQVLKAGCKNFYNLKWDNPQVDYEEVACPIELAELHCSHPYATESNMPGTCSNNL